MITKFKLFEYYNNEPKVGDYVVLYDDTVDFNDQYKDFSFFINNNVGKIYEIVRKKINDIYDEIWYNVEYDNIPEELLKLFTAKKLVNGKKIYYDSYRSKSDIIFLSENKIEAELFLSTKKYNL